MNVNRHPGKCRQCGGAVAPGEGKLINQNYGDRFYGQDSRASWATECLDKGGCKARIEAHPENVAARQVVEAGRSKSNYPGKVDLPTGDHLKQRRTKEGTAVAWHTPEGEKLGSNVFKSQGEADEHIRVQIRMHERKVKRGFY